MLRRVGVAVVMLGLVLSGLSTGIQHAAMSPASGHHMFADVMSAEHVGHQGCPSTANGASHATPERMPSDPCCMSLVCSPALAILTGEVAAIPLLAVPVPLAEAQVAMSAPTDAPFRPPRRTA